MFVLHLGAMANTQLRPSRRFLLGGGNKLQLFGSTDGWKHLVIFVISNTVNVVNLAGEDSFKMASRINIHQTRMFFLFFSWSSSEDYCQDMMYEGCCTACKEVPPVSLRAGVAHTLQCRGACMKIKLVDIIIQGRA